MKLQLQNTAYTLLFSLTTLLLVACGGGSSNSTPSGAPVTEDSLAASATIGSGGGSITATASNGVTYTLDIPPAALTTPGEISLTPISDMGSAPLAAQTFGAVLFEPSGLKFRIPATLRISAVPTLTGGRKLVGFSTANDGGSFALNLARVDGSSTLVNITHFSTGGAAEATEAELPPLEALSPTLTDADDAIARLSDLTARNAGLVQIVDVFRQWYVEIVNPALAIADGSTDIVLMLNASTDYKFWISAMDYIADRGSLDLALATELNESSPIATRIFNAFINSLLDECGNATLSVATRLASLSLASDIQKAAQSLGLTGSGLDRPTFLLRANNCVRPVLDPITLPAPLTIGTSKSLDARAQAVFADTPDPQSIPFAFTVTASGASVSSPDGFSDAEGRYTTVFTPSQGTMEFTVKACLVDVSVSDICVTQTVTAIVKPTAKTYSGTVLYQETTGNGSYSFSGFLRVSINDSGALNTMQIVDASGVMTGNDTSEGFCPINGIEIIQISTAHVLTATMPSAASVYINPDGTFDYLAFNGTHHYKKTYSATPGCPAVTVEEVVPRVPFAAFVKATVVLDSGGIQAIVFDNATPVKTWSGRLTLDQ